jgi:hypothetical protein
MVVKNTIIIHKENNKTRNCFKMREINMIRLRKNQRKIMFWNKLSATVKVKKRKALSKYLL